MSEEPVLEDFTDSLKLRSLKDGTSALLGESSMFLLKFYSVSEDKFN